MNSIIDKVTSAMNKVDKTAEADDIVTANQQVNLKLALFGGSGVGLLFGIIMGTSITPTVATILGALTGMLAGILGLNDGNFGDAKAVRIGGFGFACVFGAYLGIFVRSHSLLSPSLLSLKQQYIEVGFDEAQALDFVAQREFGVSLAALGGAAPPVDSANADTEEATDQAAPAPAITTVAMQIHQQHSSLLFSADVDLSSCDELASTDDSLPLDEIINNFELTGELWETAALLVTEQVEPGQQKAVMLATKQAICASGTINDESCPQMKPLTQQGGALSYPQLMAEFAKQGKDWQQLAVNIEQQDLSAADKHQSLFLIINTLCES
ncbi:MAG: hypothetical protein HRT35_32630 [Algicola sp.]|nr:hypothetical protein [Algicola sp.]